ncbi:two-component system response regulator [Leptolyngbya sp. 'hensonii']|uniref:response regulator n=1 Tax=Leptolyngbya sp. 'hensonii' TaxID=1922337 RepID=UPI00094F7EAA|nr:response regulator [Leptolyngbya sp. 'hensonii']OLP19072.1 two-component system response regulator [Leptolyngbya sp. 'hensonii']
MTLKRILIVDDEADIRTVAQASLEIMGDWEVITAASGHEGIAKAETEKPDLILLDVMMPDIDGPTAFLQLRANPQTQNIPVVLLTAKVQAADQRRFADLGVTAVFAKPFDPVTLSDDLMAILDRG